MAYSYSNVPLEKMLLQFMTEDDPMLAMLKWLCEKLMEAEVDAKINAAKSERTDEQSGYRSGYRVRLTMYLIEYSEDWSMSHCYINPNTLQQVKEKRQKSVA